jgi:alpha-D-ribose 1-methylphosphonate 5-triphosphate diphosphatase
MESKNGRQNTFRCTHHERDIVTDIFIDRGRALIGNEMAETSLRIAGREIAAICMDHGRSALGIDASGLLALPGIIDLHGDAFERQMMPRPGVDFPIDVALVDSDRQAISNGITTIFHATTWSWEPGLRSADNARKLLEAIEQMRPQLAADTRFHLRHETYNLDAEAEIAGWLSEGRIDLFAFNDHMDSTVADLAKPQKRSRMVERTGLSSEEFDTRVERVVSRAHECRPRSPAWRRLRAGRMFGCSRMTMRARRCGRRFARRVSVSPSFR